MFLASRWYKDGHDVRESLIHLLHELMPSCLTTSDDLLTESTQSSGKPDDIPGHRALNKQAQSR
jgi:hypothetical protein